MLHVEMDIIQGKQNKQVLWQIHKANNAWKIIELKSKVDLTLECSTWISFEANHA